MIHRFGGRRRVAVAPTHVGSGRVMRFVRQLGHELAHDNITDNGAMMAYYAILSLFPMLVFVVTVALLVLPGETVLSGIAMATQAMPESRRWQVTR